MSAPKRFAELAKEFGIAQPETTELLRQRPQPKLPDPLLAGMEKQWRLLALEWEEKLAKAEERTRAAVLAEREACIGAAMEALAKRRESGDLGCSLDTWMGGMCHASNLVHRALRERGGQ